MKDKTFIDVHRDSFECLRLFYSLRRVFKNIVADMSSGQKKYAVGVRFWLKDEQGHFMGAGRVQLLEYIKKFGSITNAAKEMKMSYRQAWQMVEDMNASAPEPLVEKILGGKGGGGARVTAMGEKVIALFHQLDEKMSTFAEELGREIVF